MKQCTTSQSLTREKYEEIKPNLALIHSVFQLVKEVWLLKTNQCFGARNDVRKRRYLSWCIVIKNNLEKEITAS